MFMPRQGFLLRIIWPSDAGCHWETEPLKKSFICMSDRSQFTRRYNRKSAGVDSPLAHGSRPSVYVDQPPVVAFRGDSGRLRSRDAENDNPKLRRRDDLPV
jgi:hypothetical protein